MTAYHLQIVTPDGMCYDGQAERLFVRTTSGDVAILARHINFVTPLGMGEARITVDGQVRRAACVGGMLSVNNGAVKLVANTFEWSDEIDLERAKRAEAAAAEKLAKRETLSETEIALAEAKIKRALIRQSVAGK